MKKRILSLILVAVMAFGICVPVSAANGTENVDITYRAIKINLNGTEITPCDAEGATVEPFIMNSNGTTYLPLRAIGQALGLNVAWDGATSTVTLTSGGKVIVGAGAAGSTTGSKNVSITYRDIKVVLDGQLLELKNAAGAAVEPFIMGGTTYLPLRVVGEALGLEVGWDGPSNTAMLGKAEDLSGVTGISLSMNKMWLDAGGSYQLTATVIPADAADKSVKWTSSDTSVATVSSTGLVTAVKGGTATVTAKTVNGKTASCTVVVQGIVPLYSVDDRVIEVKESEVDSYLKQGWYTTHVGLNVEKEGVYTYYSQGEYPWVYGSSFLYIGGEGELKSTSAPWNGYYNKVYGVYLKYGLTAVDSFAFDGWSALRRVEIPDTVTKIDSYAFDECSLLRIGIPASVTYINGYMLDTYSKPASSGNASVVIYCEKGSAAETWAKKYGIAYQYATIVYYPDGRTCMVSDAERPVYLRNGWYSVPVTTLYAYDGREKVVGVDEVSKYLAVGWYENKSEIYTTMYALDGRTKEVLNIDVAKEQKLGWYLYADYVCAMADQEIRNNGWNAGVVYMENVIKNTASSDPNYAKYTAKKADICSKWVKELGDPIAIIGTSISYNSIGVPEVNITFRNISTKTVTNLEAFWTCVDAYGNVTTDYPYLYNGNFNGWMDGISLKPGESDTYYWTMYSNERTASVRNLRMEKCAFSDGSSWYYTSWYY